MAGIIKKKEVGKYDEDWNLIECYDCVAKAAEKNGYSTQTINRRINDGKVKDGFRYKFTGNLIESNFYKNINNKNVKFDVDITTLNMNIWEERICPICGRKFCARKGYKKITCSEKCYNKYVTNNKDKINKKRRASCYKSFHSKTKEQISVEHEKARKTCMERYGVEMYQKTEEYSRKMSEMFANKDWSKRTEKVKKALIPKYKEICENDNLELIEFRDRFDCTVKCKKCGNIFNVHVLGYLTEQTNTKLCRVCYPIHPVIDSKASKFVEDIFIKYNIIFQKNNRTIISPFELDFYIPSLNLAIEVDGNWWHSEKNGRGKEYHIAKTKGCFNKGIKLIHIFEDEIVNKPTIVESRIKNLLGIIDNKIHARKCVVKEISYNEKHKFLLDNHIDGDSISKYNIGLFYNEELVCVGTFGKRKISKCETFELIRFATKIDCIVVGGFSKIMKFFDNNIVYDNLVTYADIRWSGINGNDNVYVKNGFLFDHITKPNYYYFDPHDYLKRLSRLKFTKDKLKKLGYDTKNKTEKQIMYENGYDVIWDCGSMVFIKNRE